MAERRLVTGRVRLNFVHVFDPWSSDPEKEKSYSVMLLIPKSDTTTIKAIKEAQLQALNDGAEKTFGGKVPKVWKSTLRDGDEERDADEYPEYAGHLFMNVSKKRKPGIVKRVNGVLEPIEDDTEVYSGCYARVAIDAFPFNNSGNKGVSFSLENILKVADGEPLSGSARKSAEDEFAEYDDELEEDSLI